MGVQSFQDVAAAIKWMSYPFECSVDPSEVTDKAGFRLITVSVFLYKESSTAPFCGVLHSL